MKKNITIALVLAAAAIMLGNSPAHAQTSPNASMTFWGNATVDGNPIPANSIIRAYYGANSLAGEFTVQTAGIYGSADASGKTLTVPEGSGPITFTFQQDPNDQGGETAGVTPQIYSSFQPGTSQNLNLAFTLPPPPATPSSLKVPHAPPQGEVLGASAINRQALLNILSGLLAQLQALLLALQRTTP